MRFLLTTRHRRLLILTGDDATDSEQSCEAVVDVSGGSFEPAPLPFGFDYEPGDDE